MFTLISFLFSLNTMASYQGIGVDEKVLKKFEPRLLPPHQSRFVQKYFDLRAPGMGMVTENGNRLFFTWRVTGSSQIWRLDGANTFPVQLTGGEDSTNISAILPNGKYLIVSRDEGGQENPGLYIMPTEGGSLEPIFVKEKVQTFLNHVTNDGKYVYFAANDPKPDSYAIYKYNIATRETTRIFEEPGLWSIADSWNDECFLMQKSTGSLWSEYFEWCEKDKKLVPIIGQAEKMEVSAAYAPKRGEYFISTPKFGEFHRLYLFKSGEFKSITPDLKSDIDGFWVDHKRERIFYQINDKGYTRAAALSARTLKPISLPNFGKADHVNVGVTTRNGRFTTFGVDTPTAPRVSYVFDWQTGKLAQWVKPSAPELNTKEFSVSELSSYTARDGTNIPMFVLKPKSCEKKLCPVIVHFHGGPEGQSRPGFTASWQMFVDEGFIVVHPNVRGSKGYGKTWLDRDNGAKRLEIISDIEDAAIEIKKKFSFDGKAPKIGVMGWSYGGYTTLLAMTRFAGSYDVGVAIVGISNLVTFLKNTAPYRRILRTTEYGDPETDEKVLKELSPVTYINKLKSPLLIIQGANDPRVPAGEAIQMFEKIKDKVPSDLIIFPDEGHGSSKRSNKVLELGHTLEFFKKYLR